MTLNKTYNKLKKIGVVNDKVKLKEVKELLKQNRMSDDTPEEENPYFKQVSGTHYMYMEIQPAEFINKNKLLFAEGNAIKYICRHSFKGKIEDIDKAIHYLEMIKERDYK